jgi:hypothetical protein
LKKLPPKPGWRWRELSPHFSTLGIKLFFWFDRLLRDNPISIE